MTNEADMPKEIWAYHSAYEDGEFINSFYEEDQEYHDPKGVKYLRADLVLSELTPAEKEILLKRTDLSSAKDEALRVALNDLKKLRESAETTIDQYNKNGPTHTSQISGDEYYDASYVLAIAQEIIEGTEAITQIEAVLKGEK